MAFTDNLVRIDIQQAATPVAATQTNVPLLIADVAPDWDDDKAVHTYGSLADLLTDGFDQESATYLYATKMLSDASRPSVFKIGRKAGAALTTADLDAILAAAPDYYAAIVVKGTDAEILTAAKWTQAQNKMLFAASATASNGDASSTTSLAHTLRDQNLDQTALIFSPGSADQGIEAAWVGQCITAVPGTINWAYQLLPGISADTLTTAQILACVGSPVDKVDGNNANVYISQFSRGTTLKGTTAGSYIDIVMAKDYLRFQMKAAVFTVLASGLKNPYTNKGVAVFVAVIKEVLDRSAALGIINPTPGKDADGNELPGIKVSVADVGAVGVSDRAARRAPTINFTCTLSGAVNAVPVMGLVSI